MSSERKKLVKSLREKGRLQIEKKNEEWIKEKTSFWRNYRSKSDKNDDILEDADNPRPKSAENIGNEGHLTSEKCRPSTDQVQNPDY